MKDRITRRELLRGILHEGLYQLQIHHHHYPAAFKHFQLNSVSKTPTQSAYFQSPIQSLFAKASHFSKPNLWHMRLGHPSINVMRHMLNHENFLPTMCTSFYDACHIGKSKHKHYSSSLTTTHKPLELIHSDVWGPSPTLSKDGYRYYVHFVDDFSNFTWIFP